MEENFFSSPEYALLEDEQLHCIREAGFDEVSADRSPDDIVIEWNNRLAEQDLAPDSPEVQELADFDRRIAVARFDCHAVIFPRWEELRDSVAQEYLDSNAAALAQMAERFG